MSIEQLRRELNELAALEDLMQIFEASRMTIYRWREHEGLGDHQIDLPVGSQTLVLFKIKPVLRWAARNGKATPGLAAWRKQRNDEKAA